MVYPDDLEDFVSEALYNEFDTIVEDGSLLQVCTKLCSYYDMCKKNNLSVLIEEVQKMQATQPKVEGRKEKQTNEEEDGSSSSEDEGDENSNAMDVEMGESSGANNQQQQPKEKEYDENGWEIVRHSKKR